MLAPFLMGLIGGQRAMTPLAAVAVAAACDRLPAGPGTSALLGRPIVVTAAMLLAVAEMAGDKQRTAPDRIVPIGLAGRLATAAIAGAALSPRRRRWQGAAVGGATAVAASYPGWRLRMAAIPRYGQTSTGLVEDAVVAVAAAVVAASARRLGRGRRVERSASTRG